MTSTADDTTAVAVPEGHVRLTIDDREVVARKDELIIRVAERVGVEIPRFCDHPLLDPAAACRQCLVEVEMGGRRMPKPQPACAVTVADGMRVLTQHTSPVAAKAQEGVMELLLINHPLDCPICDKGGECPLQNQALRHGRGDSRFHEPKRTFAKPIAISAQILLDRERCVLCQRCTRFSAEIAGDPFIELIERGAAQQIGTAATAETLGWDTRTGQGSPYQSYFSGNTIQICPVGALTSAAYRFRSRPFDLVSAPTVCEHCSSGCAERTDFRRGKVMRKLAGNDPEVNEEWLCDKGRFAFRYVTADDRVTRPLVRRDGQLRPASWTDALRAAADGLLAARENAGAAVLPGGRLTLEDAYAYAKFARMALHTNDIDFRARPHSAAELDFLTGRVLGTSPETGVSFADLETARAVLCVALEPEEEAPAVFLRLRKAARKSGTHVVHLAPMASPAVRKTFGTLLACPPGAETTAVTGLADHAPEVVDQLTAGGVILVGERAAEVDGLLPAVAALAERTGARLAWIPRRAGERAGLDAGAVPTMLPGGHPVDDVHAARSVATAWGLDAPCWPSEPGRDVTGILAATAAGERDGLVLGGVSLADLPDPALAEQALRRARCVVSLELRHSDVTELADVVLPVAASVEKAGTYVNWEGRRRGFATTLENTGMVSDCRVLDTLGVEMDTDLFTQTPQAALADLDRLGAPTPRGGPETIPTTEHAWPAAEPPPGQALLATWHQLLDAASMQHGDEHLAATARPVTAKLSARTAERAGLRAGAPVKVSTEHGAIELPVELGELPDGVVWLPTRSGASEVRRVLRAGYGAPVSLRPGDADDTGVTEEVRS